MARIAGLIVIDCGAQSPLPALYCETHSESE